MEPEPGAMTSGIAPSCKTKKNPAHVCICLCLFACTAVSICACHFDDRQLSSASL